MTFKNPQYLVETDWLAEHLDDPDLRILDCTQYLPDYFESVEFTTVSGRDNYQQGHIPGAAYVDLMEELVDPDRPEFYSAMPPAEQFADVMSQIGVGDGTRVILYDDFVGIFATRIWWMLRAFGFDNAAVLNGGWLKWKNEGRPISTEPASYPPGNFVARYQPELIASKEEVLATIDDNQTCLIDALSEQEYTGDPAFPSHYGRPGHIPSAVNVPFTGQIDMTSSNEYVSPDAIRAHFEESGALESDRVVTYCGGAIAATQAAHLLTLLGVENVAVYDGSLTEWGADANLPMVTGAE